MNVITQRAHARRNTGSGFFKSKQDRKVAKGRANGRYIRVGDTMMHPTKGRTFPAPKATEDNLS